MIILFKMLIIITEYEDLLRIFEKMGYPPQTNCKLFI